MNDKTIVIDCGSLFTKYGIISSNQTVDNETPDSEGLLLPSSFKKDQMILETPKYAKSEELYDDKNYEFPLREGRIQNFSKYIELLRQLIEQYINYPSIQNVVITEQELSIGREREMLTEIMFEQFNFKNVFLARKPVCAMYEGICNSDFEKNSTNTDFTGIVLHSGDSYTSATPVYDGYALFHPYHIKNNFTGKKSDVITNFTASEFEFYQNASIVPVGGFNLLHPVIQVIKKDCKTLEKFEYTQWFESSQADYERSPFNFYQKTISEVHINKIINISFNTESISNVMFYDKNQNNAQNQNNDSRKCNIKTIIENSLFGVDEELKNQLMKNIVLSGGNTSHFGFAYKVRSLYQNENVIEPKDLANFVIWEGAKRMVNSPNFSSRWATRDEYMENGPCIGQMKFF